MAESKKREPWVPLLRSYPFSEKINAISPGAETLFTRLLAQADDYGNYFGDPRLILATLFPHRWANRTVSVTDTGRWRTELVTCKAGPLAAIYSVNGKEYLHLINARRRLRKDVAPSEKYPREPEDLEEMALLEYVTKAARKRPVDVALEENRIEKKKASMSHSTKGKDSMSQRVKDSKPPLFLSGKTPKQKAKEAQFLLDTEIWPRLKELQKKAKWSKKEIEEQLLLEKQEAYLVDGLDTGRW